MQRRKPEELVLWQRALRDVAPLRARALPGKPTALPGPRHPAAKPARAGDTPVTVKQAPLPPLDAFAGVDRATAERVRRGGRAIEARLDLHGMTQAEAHQALADFVAGSRRRGRRCVLVITGHGRRSGGVLKHAVPRWLSEPALRQDLLAIAPARPQHGGSGALYLLLRRST